LVGRRKSWREKLERDTKPKVVDDPKGRGRMLVPTPLMVDSLIRRVPRGRLITVDQIREKLAKDFGADFTCPLATGWFLRISAEAAEEDLAVRGKSLDEITPYWRVVKRDGRLNEKFPGGVERQAQRLREEGFTVVAGDGRRPPRVKDYEKFLVKLN